MVRIMSPQRGEKHRSHVYTPGQEGVENMKNSRWSGYLTSCGYLSKKPGGKQLIKK